MDRLPLVVIAVGLAAACGDNGASSSPPPARQRVNAVKAVAADRVTPAELCDVFPAGADAPAFAWPELADTAPAPQAGYWLWINVWATWCEPCVEELPRLAAWQRRLERSGARVSLRLLSADESDDAVAAFRAEHQGMPPSLRVASPPDVPGWLERLGIADTALPVHVFVDPAGRVRCLRASAVTEPDYAAVDALVR